MNIDRRKFTVGSISAALFGGFALPTTVKTATAEAEIQKWKDTLVRVGRTASKWGPPGLQALVYANSGTGMSGVYVAYRHPLMLEALQCSTRVPDDVIGDSFASAPDIVLDCLRSDLLDLDEGFTMPDETDVREQLVKLFSGVEKEFNLTGVRRGIYCKTSVTRPGWGGWPYSEEWRHLYDDDGLLSRAVTTV